jgi:ferredoxin--NADP+ reductase
VGMKQFYEFPCDSVVFAVGDKVDETLGLPYKNGSFITNPVSTSNDPDDALFQAYDERNGKVIEGVFLTGWARKASEGLVGIAKRDGEWCAEVLTRYLETLSPRSPSAIAGTLQQLRTVLQQRSVQVIDVEGLRVLEACEKEQRDRSDYIGEFKFPSNEEMLTLIQQRRESSRAPATL